MFVVVAVEAEQLPVAAVGRVVVVVVILVMDGQLAEAPPLELAAASRTEMGKQFQRLLPISLLAERGIPVQLCENLRALLVAERFLAHGHMPWKSTR